MAKGGKDQERRIIRIAVTPAAKEVITDWSEKQDMTEIGVASRVYEWFGRQPEDLQRAILGLLGKRDADVARMLLEELAGKAGPKQRGQRPAGKRGSFT